MRAMGVTEYGEPTKLHWMDVLEPHAATGEVRVKVAAVTVNPIDAIIRSGHFGAAHEDPGPPAVPGMDLCGVIDEVGDDVPEKAGVALGDRIVGVAVPAGLHGSYAEYVTLPWESVAPAPSQLDDAHASSFPMNALTAWGSMRGIHVQPGETLAVTGAAGALGGYLVQLAHRRGIKVIASASAADEQSVRGFGADVFVDRAAGVQGFLDAAPEGVDAVADTAALHTEILPAIKEGGRIAIYLPWKGDATPEGIELWHNIVMKDCKEADAIRELTQLAADGDLAIRVADVMPMDDAAKAHQRLAEGHLRGRLVLSLDA